MWIILVFAVFFLIGALANTFGPKPNLIEATAGYAIALCLFEVTRLFRRHERQTAEFCEWLVDHRETIEAGIAEYRGRLIGVDTELTQYHMSLSFGVVSVKAPSRLYVVAEEPTFIPALFFTVSSLLLGWWGLPHGPIYTIGAVFSNLHGGKRRLAGDLIVELTAPEGEQARSRDVVKLTERAAQNVYRILAERGFPDGTALCVEVAGDPGFLRYSVSYDELPPTDGSVWKGSCHGIPVIVRKRDQALLAGLEIDFVGGEFTFNESSSNIKV